MKDTPSAPSAPSLFGPCHPSSPPEQCYSFLEALLSAVDPSAVIGAKEWILRKSIQDPAQIGKIIQPSLKGDLKGRKSKDLKSDKGATAACVASDKQAHSLIFKIEEFEWRLLSVLHELDRQQKCFPRRQRQVSAAVLVLDQY